MAKRTYSNPQKLYLAAKAILETAEQEQSAAEALYIKKKEIVNPDGTTPKFIFMIDDEATFEAANIEFSEIPEHKVIWERILEAREILKGAETNLLDYALNVVPVPAKERAVLTEAVKTNYATRQKVIDLVMSLDPRTHPA